MTPRRAPARPVPFAGARIAWAIPLLLACAAGATLAHAEDAAPAIPEATGYVTDAAGVLREDTRAKLESFLDQVHEKSGAQFAVLTVRSTAPMDPSDYKVRVFERWKIGQKGKDDGLLLLVSMNEHAVRFETGYGLEGALPDGLESRIVRDLMVPAMRAGDVDGAVTQGVLAAAARIAKERNVTLTWNGSELRYDASSGSRRFPPWAIAFALFLIFGALRSRMYGMGRRRGIWMGPGGWGGGFGGFGGGFGGGGGGSFGGFGGGSSGGGGGGGNW